MAVLVLASHLFAQTNRFGGLDAVTVKAPGRFALEKIRDRWWFVTPDGHAMIALGVNHLNEVRNAPEYPGTVLAQRFGKDWSRVHAEIESQIRSWGFNSAGFFPPQEMRRTMPYIVTTKFISASFWSEPLAYVDVFSSAFAAEAETKAVAAATEMKANPMAMAWAWSDSLSWDLKLTRQTRNTDFVSFLRGLAVGAPGRDRYIAFLRARHDGDIARLNAAYGSTFASFEAVGGASLNLDRAPVFADDREFL